MEKTNTKSKILYIGGIFLYGPQVLQLFLSVKSIIMGFGKQSRHHAQGLNLLFARKSLPFVSQNQKQCQILCLQPLSIAVNPISTV